MKALHFFKTSDGARWGCEMVEQLIEQGIEVTVVLPSSKGKMIPAWKKTGAKLIYAYSELPIKKIWNFYKVKKVVRDIIKLEQPDVIHSHFFSQTILLRSIKTNIIRIFQVPGPLHLENWIFRKWDLLSAKSNDRWIASSQYIRKLYVDSGVEISRIGLSYYGNHLSEYDISSDNLREEYNLKRNDFVVGNLSYFYPPKKYLLQKVGLKGHELFIEILKDLKLKAVIFGAQIGKSQKYFDKLRSYN
jgi:hypothetical protein